MHVSEGLHQHIVDPDQDILYTVSFTLQKRNAPTQFKLFFYTDKVTCNTNKATRSKTKTLSNFQFGGREVL